MTLTPEAIHEDQVRFIRRDHEVRRVLFANHEPEAHEIEARAFENRIRVLLTEIDRLLAERAKMVETIDNACLVLRRAARVSEREADAPLSIRNGFILEPHDYLELHCWLNDPALPAPEKKE
jgi:hypothetical protein